MLVHVVSCHMRVAEHAPHQHGVTYGCVVGRGGDVTRHEDVHAACHVVLCHACDVM